MRIEDAFDFCDGIRVEEGFVAIADDQFGFRALKMATRVSNDSVVSRMRRTGLLLSDDAVQRGLRALPSKLSLENHCRKKL
jgi:hypothetical protein